MDLFRAEAISVIGRWCVEGDEQGITRIYTPHEAARTTPGEPPRAVATGVQQLDEYFAGQRRDFRVQLHPVKSTIFQREVWAALRNIGYGEVRTYGEVASAVHRPRAGRAVGNANHANPWPILIPCHRVVAANGLGGYGGGGYGGGGDTKRFLLELEGVDYF